MEIWIWLFVAYRIIFHRLLPYFESWSITWYGKYGSRSCILCAVLCVCISVVVWLDCVGHIFVSSYACSSYRSRRNWFYIPSVLYDF